MPEIFTIGSALVDIFITSPELQLHQEEGKTMMCQLYGEKLTVDTLAIHSGGAGGNTAVGFQRLGFETAAVVEIGQDTLGQVVLEELKKEGVSTALLIKEKREQTGGSVILVNKDGGRTALVYRGAASMLDKSDLPVDELGRARWIHLSSVGGRTEVIQTVFNLARHFKVGLSWNPGRTELDLLVKNELKVEETLPRILILNKEEWQSIVQHQAFLLEHCPVVVVTDGARGGEVYQPHQSTLSYQSQKVTSVDDTGAGDAFSVGFVGAQLRGKSVSEAAEWGVANACAVVQQVGAKPGLLRRTEIETMGAITSS